MLHELHQDTQLLLSNGIMDYSLLVGVHNQSLATSQIFSQIADVGGGTDYVAETVDVPRYYLGVVDMLQKWNLSKRAERWSKIILKGRWAEGSRNGMSAVDPETYRRRFLAGMAYQLGLSAEAGHEVRGA